MNNKISMCLWLFGMVLSVLPILSCNTTQLPPVTPLYALEVDVNQPGTGSVSPTNGAYPEGTQVTVIAAPSPGYRFHSWSTNNSYSEPVITILMDTDIFLTANFERIKYSLKTFVSPALGGTVEPTKGFYDSNTEVTLTATPSAGFEFVSWSGGSSSTDPSITIVMDSDKQLEADFEQIHYNLTTEVTPDGSGSIFPDWGHCVDGEIITLIATPSPVGWAFSHWEGDVSSENSTLEIVMNRDIHAIACFRPVNTYTFTVTVLPIRDGVYGGEIRLTPAGGVYNENTLVTANIFLAPSTKFTRYAFVNMSDSASFRRKSISITIRDSEGNIVYRTYQEIMDSDKMYTACFEEYWVCPYGDEAEFTTKEALINHINTYHPGEELPQ